MSQAAAPKVLTYATGTPSTLSPRGWRILLWVGGVHLAAMLVVIVFHVRNLVSFAHFIHGAPLHNWYVIALIVSMAAVPAMLLANALAVAGYTAGLKGRSPRRWFLIYVPVQLALMALLQGIITAQAIAGPYQLTPNSSVGTHWLGAVLLPLAFSLINLPAFLLLFGKIRRACFAA
jgi:hypothetical protein